MLPLSQRRIEFMVFDIEISGTTNCAKPYTLLAVLGYTNTLCALLMMNTCICRLTKYI